jgi:uncharacterized cupin superfamily protein
MVSEARLEETGWGLAPATAGWFVVNVRDAVWQTHAFGDACFFESEEDPFDQLGFAVRVLWPGRTTWLYHSESAQEAFLVLNGEALMIVEDQERRLRAWDFVHCPAGTRHAFLPIGDTPSVIAMVGARLAEHTYWYPRTALAVRHGVAAHVPTTSPQEALAPFDEWKRGTAGKSSGLPWSSKVS